MSEQIPVEVGQWRRSRYIGATIYAVLAPHPRRKGFWIVVSSSDPHCPESWGGRQLMDVCPTLVEKDYFGGRPHPGEAVARTLAQFEEQMRQSRASGHEPLTGAPAQERTR